MAPSAAGTNLSLLPPFSKAASLLLYFFLYVALVTLTLFKSAFDIRKQRIERKRNSKEVKLLHSKPSETGLNEQLGAALSQIINNQQTQDESEQEEESDAGLHKQRQQRRRRRRKETTLPAQTRKKQKSERAGNVEVLLDMTRAGMQALDRWTRGNDNDNDASSATQQSS